jgi:AcrR family transcriptional regulator
MTTTTKPGGKRLDTETRRSHLIAVGLELFGATPYDQVSMADVARSASVSEGLAYHYFSSKRDLFVSVVKRVVEDLLEATRARATAQSPRERLDAGLGAHVSFAERFPHAYSMVVQGGSGVDREVRELCEQARWAGLEEIIRSSGIADPSPRLKVALRGWSGFQEGAIIEWLKRRDLEESELVDLLADALMATVEIGRESP